MVAATSVRKEHPAKDLSELPWAKHVSTTWPKEEVTWTYEPYAAQMLPDMAQIGVMNQLKRGQWQQHKGWVVQTTTNIGETSEVPADCCDAFLDTVSQNAWQVQLITIQIAC